LPLLPAYRKRHPEVLATNPWAETERLRTKRSKAHRPWPKAVLSAVMRGATPEFRTLLVGYLLTAQRGGDVTRFGPHQYDAAARTLNLTQEKTDEPLLIHVPEHLARIFEEMKGRRPDVLFVTPRGVPWTTANAQETLQRLLANLGLPRFTLHGLRATGPVALKMLGFENRAIRALTGHTSDGNLETYLAGVDHYPLARQAQEALGEHYGPLLDEVMADGLQAKSAGVTGREAAKRGVVGRARDRRTKRG
jgi:integrase